MTPMMPEAETAIPRVIRKSTWLLLLVAVPLLAYSGSLIHPLSSLDDLSALVNNPDLSRMGSVPLSTRWLVDLSFRLNFALSGLNAADFRLTNVLIHAVAGLFLFGILARTLVLSVLPPAIRRRGEALAGVTALLWSVHPLQTQAVTYVCQRYESMMGLFVLATLYCFVRGLASPRAGGRAWFALSIVLCCLGMGTKDVMVVAPVLLILYDAVFGMALSGRGTGVRIRVHVGLFLSWGVFIMLWLGGAATAMTGGPLMVGSLSPWEYLRTQFGVVLYYFRLALVPYPLCLDYAWPVENRTWVIALTGAIILGLAWASLKLLFRRRPLGFVGAWVLGILVPSSSVFPIYDRMVEHRMYLSLAGILVLVVAVVAYGLDAMATRRCGSTRQLRAAGILVALAGVLAASMLTVARNRDYASAETMWRDVLQKRPLNWRAYINLAAALNERGAYDEAIRLCERMLDQLPRRVKPAGNGQVAAEVYEGMDTHYYARAQELVGVALDRQGRLQEAVTRFEESLAADPAGGSARLNLASLLCRIGRRGDGLREFERLTQEKPKWAEAWYRRGQALLDAGRPVEAVRVLEQALWVDPLHVGTLASLAWIRATTGLAELRDGREAVRLAHRLLLASGGESVHGFEILAAALAENGNFPAAIEAQESAIQLSVASNDPAGIGRVAALEERLALYRVGKPYLDPATTERPAEPSEGRTP